MNTPSRAELEALMQIQEWPCISLFFPTYRGGVDMQQNHMTLINQVRGIEQRLQSAEHPSRKKARSTEFVSTLLQPLYALLEDKAFWQHPDHGLAVLRSPDRFHAYWLPFSVKEQAIVASHFYMKPLLPLLNDGRFYVLALSQNDVRLLEGTRYGIHLLELPDAVPESLAEALRYEQPDNQVRHYSSSSGAQIGKGGRRAAIFYGQGIGIDEAKENILRYFQQIDRGLHELFHDQQAPLVLAGVEYLLPIYQEANTYPHLIEQGIAGNPDRLSMQTLHERAWPLVEPYTLMDEQEALARYKELEQTPQASSNVSDIVPAAYDGRVADLFVALDYQQWGTFSPSTHAIEVHEIAETADDDLLDVAAAQTVLHGGAVYAVEQALIPGEVPLAAVFRY